MNQQLLQDIQQIRVVCQQLSQNERQNAQLFSQQPGLQVIAQRESIAADQLLQCVSLCNRLEQNVSRTLQQQAILSQQQYQPFSLQQQYQPFSLQQQYQPSSLQQQFGR